MSKETNIAVCHHQIKGPVIIIMIRTKIKGSIMYNTTYNTSTTLTLTVCKFERCFINE